MTLSKKDDSVISDIAYYASKVFLALNEGNKTEAIIMKSKLLKLVKQLPPNKSNISFDAMYRF